MREAIERVIAELDARREANDSAAMICYRNGDSKYIEGVNSGRAMAYQAAVHQLKVVLADGDTTPNSSQVRSEENHD